MATPSRRSTPGSPAGTLSPGRRPRKLGSAYDRAGVGNGGLVIVTVDGKGSATGRFESGAVVQISLDECLDVGSEERWRSAEAGAEVRRPGSHSGLTPARSLDVEPHQEAPPPAVRDDRMAPFRRPGGQYRVGYDPRMSGSP